LHILHYGFDGKYLPIGFDVLFIKILNMARFLDGILAIACSTLLNDINLRVSLVMIVKSCYSKIVASIMACSRSPTPCMDEVRFLR
jgi:hypothetical protein